MCGIAWRYRRKRTSGLRETLTVLQRAGARQLRASLMLQLASALETLAVFPFAGAVSSVLAPNRRYVLTAQFALLYRVDEEAREVDIVTFLSNRQT